MSGAYVGGLMTYNHMLQLICGISQSLGLTESTRQSVRLSDTTSQYKGLPKNISQSLGLPEIFSPHFD